MQTETGWVNPEVGNAIRLAIIEWCSTYRTTPAGISASYLLFSNVKVELNKQTFAYQQPAIRISCTIRPSPWGGDLDKLRLQHDFLGFATQLHRRFGVHLDTFSIDISTLHISFLAPDGARIPPFDRY